ncbi:MAG: GNAT family N-acetyltransferase [Bacteroidetes bacterium]|nr:GNAT family N-acetyltransferase [Fibrella sp.]
MTHTIDTERIQLVACDAAIFTALLAGKAAIGTLLNVAVPNRLTSYGNEPFRYSLNKIQQDPVEADWWMYLPIYKPENLLVGTCGYKGKPDEHGMVEIGYEIIKSYRRRGLGTEVAKALIGNAFADTRVEVVQAHTLAKPNPSTKILRACGMTREEELTDPDDGLLWRWQLNRTYPSL